MRKSKVLRGVQIAVCVLLTAAAVVACVLFFPLTGKKHIEIWAASQPFELDGIQTVAKTRQDFKILMFTDTQLWTILGDNSACYAEMDSLVEKAKPDLIVLPGDILSAFASRFSIHNFVRRMDAYQIPWAPVFGNHDAELPTNSKNWQADQYIASEYCLFQKGPSNLYGCGNYVLNITEDGAPVYTVFMLDNGAYETYEDGANAEVWMDYAQIAWYEWNVKGIAKAAGRTVPSMTFSHFALPEFAQAVEAFGVLDETSGVYTIPAEYGFGKCAYLPGASPVNSGFFEKCRELGSTKYIFCGHDHENNASVSYKGITMTYGLKTGPSPRPWNHAGETGGTLITLRGSAAEQSVQLEHIVVSESGMGV